MDDEIKIDEELRGLIRPLTDGEVLRLENSIAADGCLDPLCVWKETGILLDGHHRKDLCEALGAGFQIKQISLPDRDAAIAWIHQKNDARRHETPDERRARIESRREKVVHLRSEGRSNRAIADETGVSEAQIRKDLQERNAAKPDSVTGRDGKTYPAEGRSTNREPRIKEDRGGPLDADGERYMQVLATIREHVDRLGEIRPPANWKHAIGDQMREIMNGVREEWRRVRAKK